jgi:hypothetical protein
VVLLEIEGGRRLAQLAIASICGWILLGIAFGLALRYG